MPIKWVYLFIYVMHFKPFTAIKNCSLQERPDQQAVIQFLNIFVFSGLGNKLLQLILICFHFPVASATLQMHQPALFRNLQGCLLRARDILTWISHLSSPSQGLPSFLKTILANGVKAWTFLPCTVVLVVRCANHYNTALDLILFQQKKNLRTIPCFLNLFDQPNLNVFEKKITTIPKI